MHRRSFLWASMGGLAMWACGGARAGTGHSRTPSRSDKVIKTEEEWASILTPEQFRILRKQGTERSFTGKYWDDKTPGVFHCAGCDLPLFDAKDKFKSGTGWPSYTRPITKDAVDEHTDSTLGMVRTEVVCARCAGHLGHVFPDGPKPTGLRYCINGNALNKKPSTASTTKEPTKKP